jgi:hypothetical protein
MESVSPTPSGGLGSNFFYRGSTPHLRQLSLISSGFCDLSCGHHQRAFTPDILDSGVG